MAKPGYQGLTRIIKAAGYSAKGFRAAWKYESAFRQEVVLTGALIPFAFWLGRDPVEIAMLVASLLLVVIVELLNSGLKLLSIVSVMSLISFQGGRKIWDLRQFL